MANVVNHVDFSRQFVTIVRFSRADFPIGATAVPQHSGFL